MNDHDISLPELSLLIEQRLDLVRNLAESLESSTPALARNDVEAIARGAAHQAELCRQWSHLEDRLRPAAAGGLVSPGVSKHFSEAGRSAHLQAEWDRLGARIRYLTRVHWSLLRHLERSLAVLGRVIDSCAGTYTAKPSLRTEA